MRWVRLGLALGIARAHVILTYPPARFPPLDFLDSSQTGKGPCGIAKPANGFPPAVLLPVAVQTDSRSLCVHRVDPCELITDHFQYRVSHNDLGSITMLGSTFEARRRRWWRGRG